MEDGMVHQESNTGVVANSWNCWLGIVDDLVLPIATPTLKDVIELGGLGGLSFPLSVATTTKAKAAKAMSKSVLWFRGSICITFSVMVVMSMMVMVVVSVTSVAAIATITTITTVTTITTIATITTVTSVAAVTSVITEANAEAKIRLRLRI